MSPDHHAWTITKPTKPPVLGPSLEGLTRGLVTVLPVCLKCCHSGCRVLGFQTLRQTPVSERNVQYSVRVMARYVPKHRKKRKLRDHSRVAGIAAFVVASVASLSGSFGFVPGAIAETNSPFAVESSAQPGAVRGSGPASSLLLRQSADAAIDSATAKQPTYVSIKSIGASSEIVQLGLEPDGSLEVPVDFNVIGWFNGSVEPGERGAAVFAGHAASHNGPGIFKNLAKLKPDDQVRVARSDGELLTFAVTRIDSFPKDYFPTEQVYGRTTGRELRLITCGGKFDAELGSYTSNVVVYASLVPNTKASTNQ
jgi:Sortase domain